MIIIYIFPSMSILLQNLMEGSGGEMRDFKQQLLVFHLFVDEDLVEAIPGGEINKDTPNENQQWL